MPVQFRTSCEVTRNKGAHFHFIFSVSICLRVFKNYILSDVHSLGEKRCPDLCRSPAGTTNALAALRARDFHLNGQSEIDPSVRRSVYIDLNNNDNVFAQSIDTNNGNEGNQHLDIVEMYQRSPSIFDVNRRAYNLAFGHFPYVQPRSEKAQKEMYELFEASKRAYFSMMAPWWQTVLSFRPNHFQGDILPFRFHKLHSYLSSPMYITSSNVLPLDSHSPTTNYESLKMKDECCSAHVDAQKEVEQHTMKESILSGIKRSGTKLTNDLKGHVFFLS